MTDGLFRYSLRTFWRELAMIVAAVIWWVPFYLLVIISVKPSDELFTDPNGLPDSLAFSNYADAWHGVGGLSLGSALQSSLIITIGSVIALILIGSLAAYTIARREGRLGAGLYLLFVIGIIVPFQLGVIPAYIALRAVGLVGSYLGTILLYTGLMMPLSVFLYTGFVRRLPLDYEEAAYVDGASRVRTFVRVVFPLLRPVTATVAVLTAVIIWNDFFTQLLFLSGSKRQTLPVAVYAFVGQYATQWNFVFASVVVAIVPVLLFYIVAQRQLIRGFSGGIKT
jgi:raffinose/stachyose/melibiose transport system permease protein